jgi:hypothetical protein
MKNVLASVLVIYAFLITGCKGDAYDPGKYFKPDDQVTILSQCVRYSAKLPPTATHQTKFNSEHNEYYNIALKEYDWRKCYPVSGSEGEYFFLITRQARSLWPAREAIGGMLKVDKKNKNVSYEEIFRTWKMAKDSLDGRAAELFDHMIKGEDLTPFTAKYQGDRYIEYPDDRFYFDKTQMQWRDRAMDSLRPENKTD